MQKWPYVKNIFYFLMPGAILFPSVMLANDKLIKTMKYINKDCILLGFFFYLDRYTILAKERKKKINGLKCSSKKEEIYSL